MKQALHIGPLVFRDPVLLCGVLYVLLWFDASGFLRLGLCAAFLHEWGHILVYRAIFRTFPTIEVTLTGFCMRTRGRSMTPQPTRHRTTQSTAASRYASKSSCRAFKSGLRIYSTPLSATAASLNGTAASAPSK